MTNFRIMLERIDKGDGRARRRLTIWETEARGANFRIKFDFLVPGVFGV